MLIYFFNVYTTRANHTEILMILLILKFVTAMYLHSFPGS